MLPFYSRTKGPSKLQVTAIQHCCLWSWLAQNIGMHLQTHSWYTYIRRELGPDSLAWRTSMHKDYHWIRHHTDSGSLQSRWLWVWNENRKFNVLKLHFSEGHVDASQVYGWWYWSCYITVSLYVPQPTAETTPSNKHLRTWPHPACLQSAACIHLSPR